MAAAREKVLLEVGRRQVPLLAVAALLLFGAVFGLGVYIGKGLMTVAPAAQPLGDLKALDERKEAAAAADAERERQKVREREKQEQERVSKEQADAAAKEKAAREQASRDARKRAEEQKAALRAKALQGAAAAARPADEEAEEDTGAPASSFTVQIGSSTSRAEADRIVQKARTAGLQPFIVEANLGDKGTWYRVRVGSFQARADADKFKRDVERELGGRALVMPAR